MGLGVLNSRRLQAVPGTATLEELRGANVPLGPNVKHNKHGIVLVPQPSDDPEDPLNWPLWQRDLITFFLGLFSVIAATGASLLAANTETLLVYYKGTEGVTPLALLTGYQLLGTAISGAISVPSARVWGKRHLYIIGGATLIVASLWGGGSGHNYNSLVGARFFQGVGLGPFEALANASVGDLYFVHERGVRLSFTNLALFGGSFLTPVVVGILTKEAGWQWSFWLLAIVSAVFYPAIVLIVPETAYRRDVASDALVEAQSAVGDDAEKAESFPSNKDLVTTDSSTRADSDEAISGLRIHHPNPKAEIISRRRLRMFTGRKTDEHFFRLFLRPFAWFANPAIVWACLVQGTMIGWTTLLGIVLATIFIGPPLVFSEVQTGYLYAGAFVGSIIGFAFAAALSDTVPRLLTHLNKGTYEPEFRMPLVALQLVFGCAGLYGFGFTASDLYTYGWFWPDFFFAVMVIGLVLGTVAAASYIVDGYKETAIEGLTCLVLFKNFFAFALTYCGFEWLEKQGIYGMFITIASIQVGVSALTIPMYIFGKTTRSFWARHDLFAMLHLK